MCRFLPINSIKADAIISISHLILQFCLSGAAATLMVMVRLSYSTQEKHYPKHILSCFIFAFNERS